MLRYPCLVLDHDDTVVMSEATVNFPYFQYILNEFRPGQTVTKDEFIEGCCKLGFAELCRRCWGFTEEELVKENLGWQSYVQDHAPDVFPGIQALLHRYRAAGGHICVVSHSYAKNIARDYQNHFGFLPDAIYGWDYPEQQRKPSPYPLERIMETFGYAPQSLLVVDDMFHGCSMAKAAGVAVAFAAWGRRDYPALSQQMRDACDFTFETPQALLEFLLADENH